VAAAAVLLMAVALVALVAQPLELQASDSMVKKAYTGQMQAVLVLLFHQAVRHFGVVVTDQVVMVQLA
jgi:hypothetical protein